MRPFTWRSPAGRSADEPDGRSEGEEASPPASLLGSTGGDGSSRRGLGAAIVEVEHGADVLQAQGEPDAGVGEARPDQRLELADLEAQAIALLRPVDRI